MPPAVLRVSSWLVEALLWLWLFFHLHYEWSLNSQYSYGWAVPFLAALLFFFRWPERPSPSPGRPHGPTVLRWLILTLLLPLRLIEEANPDWRLLSWAFALLVVSYSLLGLWRCGGATWVRYFAFPVCFPLIAVPWLARFENGVVHGLTRGVAFAAVEIAGWLRIGAYQRGNIIELANGIVGVDEACSGGRTLQAAIMVALFLGEILRLRAGRRVALVAAGCGWVFVCNIVRATALVIIGARTGLPALEQWHDLVGNAVLLFGMAGLAVIASVLREPQQPGRGAVTASAARAISLPEMGAALAWLALVFAATELWYRAHERELVPRPLWTAHWPQGSNATALPIAESTAVVLRYNQASSAAWTGPGGERWWGFFARWEPKRTALQLVRSHSPEI